MNDCNEWGVVYILDTLTAYLPKDPQEAENIMERVSSRLAHTNSAVALSSIRLIIRYMDFLSSAEAIRTYNNKISKLAIWSSRQLIWFFKRDLYYYQSN
jgi:AP-1 complex subunit beta-1